MKRLLAALAATLIAGCSAPATPPPPAATVTVTASASPTASASAEQEVCDYGVFQSSLAFAIVSSWDLVKASRGESDHPRMVQGFIDTLKSAQEDEQKGCIGAVESAKLMFELSVLNADVQISGEAEDEQYQAIVDAGNEWFKAVGFTEYTFSMKPNDSKM